MSRSSMMMSPKFRPIRNSMRRSCGTAALRFGHEALDSTAQRTAPTTLAKLDEHAVASSLDDASAMLRDFRFDYRPPVALSGYSVPSSSTPSGAIAGNIRA